MKRVTVLLGLAAAMFLCGALSLPALGLDVELKAGGGMAMGTTDDSNKSGELRWALNAALTADLLLLQTGPLALGVSAGAGYANLHYHGVDPKVYDPLVPTFTTQTSDSAYNYVLFPLAVVGKLATGSDRGLTLRAGGFAGYFLSGTSDLAYDPDTVLFTDMEGVDLDDSNTEVWMYGLSLYAGLDLLSRGRLAIVPSLQFDIGLTDTSIDAMQPTPSKDTFWALTANVGIRYSVLR